MVVTSQALAAAAFLNAPKELCSSEDLSFRVETYLSFLHHQGTEVTGNLIEDPAEAVRQAVEHFIGKKYIQRVSGRGSAENEHAVFRLNPSRRVALAYYGNSATASFIPAVYTALAILGKDAFQFSASDLHNGYQVLQELLEYEFAKDADKPEAFIVRKTVKAFIDDAILVPHRTLPDTYHLTSEGYRKMIALAAFAKPFLEAYKVVLQYLGRYPKGIHDKKRRLKKIQTLGQRMLKRGEIELPEGLSAITYNNAIDRLMTMGLRGAENRENINEIGNALERYLKRLS